MLAQHRGKSRLDRRRLTCTLQIGVLSALLLSLALPGATHPAAAQSAASASIGSLDTSSFPSVRLYLNVQDAEGAFIPGITADQVTVLENNQPLPVTEFEQAETGVQFVTAMTLGPSFGVRDGMGVERYTYLQQGLQAWQWPPDSQDDLSLLISDGPELIHHSDPAEWLDAISGFQPAARQATPNLQLLNSALEIAADPLPRPGMQRLVLFITPPLGIEAAIGLQSLAGRALQEGIRVHVWLVASAEYLESPETNLLRDLAAQTGGSFFFFSGSEPVPDLENYLQPLRPSYYLTYSSAVTITGALPVSVEIHTDELDLIAPPRLAQYKVQPPNPVFMAVPVEIQRLLSGDSQANPAQAETPVPMEKRLVPVEQKLEILVEFPDGSPRPLQHSALYVNNQLVAENTHEPFEHFTWDLRTITQTQSYLLRAEVTDSLGLTASTVEIPVKVNVRLPSEGLKLTLSNRGLLLTGATVLLAGGVLALVLVIGGRIRPRIVGRPDAPPASLGVPTRPTARIVASQGAPTRPIGKATASQAPTRPTSKPTTNGPMDLVTQPVNIPQPSSLSARRRWNLPHQLHMPAIPTLKWPQHRVEPRRIETFLEPLPTSEEAAVEAPLPLGTDEIIIGRSPDQGATQATLVINEPSVEAVHAILHREEDGYRLSDTGSIAGTWVNYLLVPPQGVTLQHGDLIHIGRVGFRFALRSASSARTRKPAVLPYRSTDKP